MGVWLTGRPYFHVGASGLVYGLFSFIVSYGVVTKNREHLGAAFLSVFLYGSMVWGIFPVRPEHSWEGHLWGFLIGIALGVYYGRKRVLEKKQAILHETYFHSSSDVEGLEWNYSYFDNEEKTSEKEEYKQ